MENKYKLISFLDDVSLKTLNEIAKRAGIKYIIKKKKLRTSEKINYKKLMETPPGFGDK
ncbi:MAG: hypothetical protein PVJ67_04165 [Candidatus Pacearchaeota archaeon]|jgi:hypothetical protein